MAPRRHRTALALLVALAAACEDEESPFLWNRWILETGVGHQAPFTVAVDDRGNSVIVTVVGTELEPNSGPPDDPFDDSRVRKLDALGRELWRADIELSDEAARAVDFVVDDQGVIYVLGTLPAWLARVNAEGEIVAAPVPLEGMDSTEKLDLTDDGNLAVVGTVRGDEPPYATDIVVAKVSPDGTVLWTRTHDDGDRDNGLVVEVGPSGEIVAGGMAGDLDLWLQKYDADGNELWDEPVTYATEERQRLADITLLPDGSLLAVGNVTDRDIVADGSIAWANLYDVDGVPVWPRPFVLTSDAFQHPFRISPDIELVLDGGYASADAVALDSNGGAVIVGARETEVWFHRVDMPGVVRACPDERSRCSEPVVYERGDEVGVNRGAAIGPDGHLVLVGDPIDSDAASTFPVSGIWIGKLGSPTFGADR